ncbi:MAG: EAL domain-containing protein [Nocardioidaceae bacterium]|nr:EAL domain-containing protein [Nocardioidaceae bacterium]
MTRTEADRQMEPSTGVDAESRVGRRSRYASVALVAVLLGVSLFAVWSSQATSAAAGRAVMASGLSDDYADAADAVATEESLERKYRLEPGPGVQTRFDETAAQFVAALGRVRRGGGVDDRSFVEGVLTMHESYLEASDRLFRAVDRADTAAVLKIDSEEGEPSFEAMETAVLAAADAKHQESLGQLESLQALEVITRRLTPLVFFLGLVLAAALAAVTRGHRRLLGIERARAVHDSLHDALTGLPNRTLLADRFGQALRADARSGTSTGPLLIDLDRFKEINDTFGHHYGDELLAQVGPRLSASLRDVDTVARLGGDEFAVLLPEVRSVEDAVAVAIKLRAAMETPFRVLGVDLDVEASVGVVMSGEHGQDATTLLQRADIAMYVAKTQSRGVSAYDPDIDEHTPAKLSLLGDLRRALENDELVLHYQPKIAISTRDVVGVEALVRWQHPERGMVFPDDFIPMAEHTGLIGALTRHVLDTALAQVRLWVDAGQPLTVSVNLSARNLLDERLPEIVAELLATHGVTADLLELEVTESALMTEPVRAQRLLEELSALGVRISIDDFGAGYTSLGQLKTLPVNELKIDKSFVMTMTEDTSNDLIVHSVIDLAHNLGLSIVAEGVENEQTLAALKGYGCDLAQGYHLSRPVAPDALADWLAERPPNPFWAAPHDARSTAPAQAPR